ncbi:MAG: hypothetical protein HUU18_11110 [Phycisphaerales bacterium]|nr:hypothetical protein [Phycisphaerales bacterium]
MRTSAPHAPDPHSAIELIGMVNMRPVAIVLGVGIVVLLVLLLRAASTRFGEKPRDDDPPAGE